MINESSGKDPRTRKNPTGLDTKVSRNQKSMIKKPPTMKTPAELAPGRKPKLQASENRQRKPLKNLGELPVDLLDPDLRKNTVKPKREKPTVKPTAKKTNEAEDRNEKPVTRKQESDIKKEENKKKPKKGQAELTQRKIAIEIVDVSDDDDAQSDSHGPNRASTSRKVAGKTQTLADKNKSDPSKQPNQGVPEDDQQTVRAVERKIVCLGPRSSIPEKYKGTFDQTRKHLKRLIDHQNYQFEFAKGRKSPWGGPDQNAHRMAERLNEHMKVVIGSKYGEPRYVRNMNKKFKAKHGEEGKTKEQIERRRLKEKEKEESGKGKGKERWIPQGQMVEHVRKLKSCFAGKEERKYIGGAGFAMRLARARDLMFKETLPKLKPSVIIKAKGDRPAYVREDPRVKEALRSFKHTLRAQKALDENMDRDFGPFPKKDLHEIPLIQIHSEASDEEIDQDTTPKISTKVAITNYLMRPKLMGNLSDDEDKFEEDGTPIIVKLEKQSDDSEAESSPETDADPQAVPSTQTSTQTANQDVGTSDSSSEDDDDTPSDKAAEEAQKRVAFKILGSLWTTPRLALPWCRS